MMKKSLLNLKKTMMALPVVLLYLVLSFSTKAQTVNPIVDTILRHPHTLAVNGYSDSVTFHIQVTVGPKIVQTWYLGDTTIVVRPGNHIEPAFGHIFKYAGTYNVSLKVTDTITGTSKQFTDSIITFGSNPKPVVVKPFHYGPYTYSDSVATATLNIAPTIAFGNITKYAWTLTTSKGGTGIHSSISTLAGSDSFQVTNGAKYAFISNDSLQNPQISFPQEFGFGAVADTIFTSVTVYGYNNLAVATTTILDTIVIPIVTPPAPTPTASSVSVSDGHLVADTVFGPLSKNGCSEVFLLAPNYTVPGTDSFNVTWYLGDGSLSYTYGPHLSTAGDTIATNGSYFQKVYNSPGRYAVYYVVTDINTGLYATSPTVYLQDNTGNIPLAPTPTFTVNNITSDSVTRFGYGYRFNSSYLTDSLALVNLQATTYGNYNYVWSIQYTGTSSGIPAPLSGVTIPAPLDSASSIQLALTRPDSVLAGVSYPAYSAATEPYTVTLTINPVGCAISQSTNVVIWDSISDFASVGTNSVIGHVSTYPNPARSNVTVNTTLNKASAYVTVSVYDITGKLKQASKVDASNKVATINLNVANLSTGYYKIKVTNAEGQLIEVKSIFKN